MTGYQLKQIRVALNETQTEFAERLGLAHYQRVHEMERRGRKRIPEVTTLKLIVAGLDKLIDGELK